MQNCLIQVSPDGSMKTIVADFGLAAKIKQSRCVYMSPIDFSPTSLGSFFVLITHFPNFVNGYDNIL